MSSRLRLAILLAACLGGLPGFAAAETHARLRHHARPPAENAQIIVKFRAGAAATEPHIAAATAAEPMRALGERAGVRLLDSRPMTGSMHAVRIDTANGTVAEQLARLRADPAVEFAEPDEMRFAHAVPNDPEYVNQWFLHTPPSPTIVPSATSLDENSAIDATHAWDKTLGLATTIVAVLDTGIRYDHPDLLPVAQGGKALPGFDFVSGESTTSFVRANDGDGYDADPSDPGDWVSAADQQAHPTLFPAGVCDVTDSSWHGTRTAGLIGAATNNATGIAGIGWGVRILPVRVLGKCNGRDSDIINGMRWAAGLHVSGVPDNPPANRASVINISLGSAGTCPQSYKSAIAELTALGVLVVISAGNEGGAVDTPANCPGVLAVAGLRHAGTKVGYSNLGAEVGVSAPAGNCYNDTGPCLFSLETTTNLGVTTPGANSYTDQTNYNIGTSFSAPIVSGIAALMHGVNSHLGTSLLIARVKEGSVTFPMDPALPTCPAQDDKGQCSCTTTTCGAGMANGARSVTAALRPIASVVPVVSATASRTVTLDGSASVPADGHTIASYAWMPVAGASPPTGPTNAATTTVTAPASCTAVYRLTVADDVGALDQADSVVTTCGPLATTTTLGSSATSVQGVDSITVTVSVQASVGSVTPTGTVSVMDSASLLDSAPVDASGKAAIAIDTSGFTTGAHQLHASFAGDSRFHSSVSNTVTVTNGTPPPAAGGSSGGGGGGVTDLAALATLALAAGRRSRRRSATR